MKKVLISVLYFSLLFGCGPQQGQLEIQMEEGVEVVINHLEPYSIPGEKSNVIREKVCVIDLEDPSVSKTGLFDIQSFGVDSDKSIFLMAMQSQTNHIVKFSPDGQFLTAFGRHGQGPGELGRPLHILANAHNEIFVTDGENSKIVYFNTKGELLQEIALKTRLGITHPLTNGNIITFGMLVPGEGQDYLEYPLNLCDSEFKILKTLETFRMENARITRRIRGTQPGFGFCTTKNRIFTANEIRGYEIHVHDLDGNLIRKIRKEYNPIAITEDYKQKALERINEVQRPYTYFPDTLPPYRSIFSDNLGHLFVITPEPGEDENESMVDVFNADGAFINRMSIDIFHGNSAITALIKSDHLYYVREKENGYKQFVVEKLVWN